MGSSPSKKSTIQKALPLPCHTPVDQIPDRNGIKIKRSNNKSGHEPVDADSTDQETVRIREAEEKQSLQAHYGKLKSTNFVVSRTQAIDFDSSGIETD